MIVVAMDSPGKTFRHDIYDQYKANRPPMPQDLPIQIERIDQILAAMRIPILRIEGFEADDIIGSLAKIAEKKDLNVFICSKDKDLEQLLSDRVAMFAMKSSTVMDAASLAEKKGIRPDQVVDVLALEGDTSDNIPGVPDVGPKTAIQWIQKYGSLEGLLANSEQIKGKRGENLRANIDQARLSQRLATIDCEMTLDIDWDAMAVKPFDDQKLQEIFDQLGFQRLRAQLQNITAGQTGPPDEKAIAAKAEYHLVDNEELFGRFIGQLKKQKAFAIDTETTGLNPVAAELVGLSFAWKENQGYYIPLKGPLGQRPLERDEVLEKLRPILTDEQVKKIGQNIKYDMVILRRAGIELAGVDFDTMVASYVVDSSRLAHNLDSLATDYLGHETIKLESLLGKGKNMLTFDMVDIRQAADYAAEDADVTWRLRERLQERLAGGNEQLQKLFEQIEMPLVEVLAEMEYNGVALDVPWLKKMGDQIGRRLGELLEQIHGHAGVVFNVDSPKQLAEVLFEKIGLEPTKKTKSGNSTDQEVLESLQWQHPVPQLMLEYRQLSKLKNTYVEKLPTMIVPATGRVHASFNQAATATGRLSSSNPNMQNIPIRSELGQEIRKAFVPQNRDMVIMAADYSQIELRIMAHLSKDEAMIEAFGRGEDIHSFVAGEIYGISAEAVDPEQRRKAKAVNFGIIYGQSAYGLSRSLGITVGQAQQFIDDYFARYPTIKNFIEKIIEQADKTGYVQTILARQRAIPQLKAKNYQQRKLGERMAVNTVIQGSAADMIKLAMINIHRKIKKETTAVKMIMQVHDELVFELPGKNAQEYTEIIKQEMTQAIPLDVPVIVDAGIGKNWLECK